MKKENEERDLHLFEKAMYHAIVKNKPIKNQKMDAFVGSLHAYAKTCGFEYEEIDYLFPMELCERWIFVMIPKDKRKPNDSGVEECDVLAFNPEYGEYFKIRSRHGVRDITAHEGVRTSFFMMDGFPAIQLRGDGATLEIDNAFGMFLHLFPEGKKPLGEFAIEQIEAYIEGNQDMFKTFAK